MNAVNKNFHIALIAVAGLAALLVYTTMDVLIVGLATGVTLGLSIRLYRAHQKADFAGTKKLDWVLLVVFSGLAFALMLFGDYLIQAVLLIVVAVRALIVYFYLYDPTATTVTNSKG